MIGADTTMPPTSSAGGWWKLARAILSQGAVPDGVVVHSTDQRPADLAAVADAIARLVMTAGPRT
jgi:hypothetical protein